MLKEAASEIVGLGRRTIGFDKAEPAFVSNREKAEWEWNPRKFARNALLVLGVLWGREVIPQAISSIDRATAPSIYPPGTVLESDMDGEIRKGNLLSLLLMFNQSIPADKLLGVLEKKQGAIAGVDPEWYPEAADYPFADTFISGKPDQTIYFLDALKQTNMGALKIDKDRELYVLAVSDVTDRYKIKNTTDVTRVGSEAANEYFIVQPYYDDKENIPSKDKKAKHGELKVRFVAVGRWDTAAKDVDWGDSEINDIWQSLPRSGMLVVSRHLQQFNYL